MNEQVISDEDELLEDLQSTEAAVRKKAAEELGYMTTSDDQEVIALMDVMQNDCEDKVREMAYWALSSPANLKIISQHPEWQARVHAPGSGVQKKMLWWQNLLVKLKLR